MGRPLPREQDPCSYCGKKGHGRSAPARLRRKECPAYGTVCGHCRKDHHFESVCRAKVKVRVDTTNESAVFDALCELTIQHNLASVPLGHHVYDQQSNRWLGRSSKPEPFVRLSVNIEKNTLDFNSPFH